MDTKEPNIALARQLVERNMDKAEWGPRLPKRPVRNKKMSEWAKTNPENLATLARARVGTQMGGPNIRRCTAVARHSGQPCKNVALRGESVCRFHAGAAEHARLRQRRLDEGRPMDKAGRIVTRNMRAVLRKNILPYELLTNPQFQAVIKLVAPGWFGLPKGSISANFTMNQLRVAALLSREYVLAWTHAAETGDWSMWANTVMKAREAGFGG